MPPLTTNQQPRTVLCVGAVVRREGRILFVRQSPGHSVAGQWTLPWGRVDAGESPMDAALREVWEEGGVRAAVDGVLGVQELPEPWSGWVAIVYSCHHLDGSVTPQDVETDAAEYYSASELAQLTEPIEPWSAWLAQRVFRGDVTIIPSSQANPLAHPGAFL